MKIAITGGTGFLGRHLIGYIVRENNIPVILTRKKRHSVENNYEYRITNYSKEDLIDKLFDIDAVVHLAAKRSNQDQISEFHDDEVLTQNLYEACYKRNITNIVYASSISVYSGEQLLPWTEEHLPCPVLMYGVSKLACENIGNIYSMKKGLHVKNLRFAHLYGFNEKNNYMINLFFRQAFRREKLVVNAKSIAKREFLYVKDAAKSIICALKKPMISGIFNIGSGDFMTNYEVAERINNVFGNNGNLLVNASSQEEGINSSYMSSVKAQQVLKFIPDYTFTTAVTEIYTLMKGLDYVPALY